MGLTHFSDIADYDYQPINSAGTFAIGRRQVNTTAGTAITPGSATVTPASMNGVEVGTRLRVFGGTGTPEQVQVLSVTPTTFTAVFANSHSDTYTLVSQKNIRLARIVVNTKGTNDTITLYDGHPSDTPAGVSLGALTVPASGSFVDIGAKFTRGLWVTVGGTAGAYLAIFAELPD